MRISCGKLVRIALLVSPLVILLIAAIVDCGQKTSLFFALSQHEREDTVSFVDDNGIVQVEFKDTDGDGILDRIYDNRMPKEPFQIELVSGDDLNVAKKEIRRRNLHQMSMYYRESVLARYCYYFLYETFLRSCWKDGLNVGTTATVPDHPQR